MRIAAFVVSLSLVTAAPAFCQSTQQQQTEQAALMHKGTVKIWTAVALMAAGDVLIPVTAVRGESSRRSW